MSGKGHIVDCDGLPSQFPTHRHNAAFWEALGRAVATFGFLEETLGKAIFAFTATREIHPDKIDEEYQKWLPALEKALSDALGGLIVSYGKAVRSNNKVTIPELDDLLTKLHAAAVSRNVICHGSWRIPDGQGFSLPLYVDRKQRVWNTPIDIAHFTELQKHVVELTCAVMDTVTLMGFQFPGSSGPGMQIFQP
jgi:hypothetical protein